MRRQTVRFVTTTRSRISFTSREAPGVDIGPTESDAPNATVVRVTTPTSDHAPDGIWRRLSALIAAWK